jgi:Mn2+/Fe2+ NRAMP family transporter
MAPDLNESIHETVLHHKAKLDPHHGDIRGALGSISEHDTGARKGWWAHLRTLAAIVGPGLIVMVGDNDAGAFGTYTMAGQDYGTSLLWTMLFLIPVLYVNQEMVLRLGAVARVGHAKLIFARFGKFWGAFSVIDLFLLNALTIVTEFIGVSLAFDYLGVPKILGVLVAAGILIIAASTGSFRRFERFAMVLVIGSLLLIPVVWMVHPPIGVIVRDTFLPRFPDGAPLGTVMLLIIAIVGTTIAPWQLFFQQSYVIDKRITPRFMAYEKADLWIGIGFVLVGGVAMMALAAQAFGGHPEFGNFTDAGGVAAGLEKYYGRLPGILFALALIDASIIGACAVSLSTAYAIGDMLGLKHSLNSKPKEARLFYVVYIGLIALAALLVLTPGVPLGFLTNAVQTLAGVLLPSATVFLLLLCNDKEVLGPWRNGAALNMFTGAVIAVLVMLSIILTASSFYPDMSEESIEALLWAGLGFTVIVAAGFFWKHRREGKIDRTGKDSWQMPRLRALTPAPLTGMTRLWMIVLRLYLVIAGGIVLVKIVQLALT